MVATLLLLGLLSAVEQMAVKRLTDDAMARTQEILSLLAQNQTARGLERAREMDAWWDEEAPRVETLINHEATDDVRFTLSRLGAALEMGARLSMPESWRAASSMFWNGRRCRGRICCKRTCLQKTAPADIEKTGLRIVYHQVVKLFVPMPVALGTGQHIVDMRIKALGEQRLSQHIGRERQRIPIGAGFKKAEKALSIRVGGNGIHGDDVVILSFVDFIMPVDTRRRLNEGVGNEPLHIAFGPIQKGNKEENQER